MWVEVGDHKRGAFIRVTKKWVKREKKRGLRTAGMGATRRAAASRWLLMMLCDPGTARFKSVYMQAWVRESNPSAVGHVYAFGNTLEKLSQMVFGTRQRGSPDDPPMSHVTGLGYVAHADLLGWRLLGRHRQQERSSRSTCS